MAIEGAFVVLIMCTWKEIADVLIYNMIYNFEWCMDIVVCKYLLTFLRGSFAHVSVECSIDVVSDGGEVLL